MALFGAGAILGGIIGGKLTDKFGFYVVQLFALLSGGIMFVLLGQMSSIITIGITIFFLAVVNESFRPANAVAISQYSTDANRTRSYSLNRLSINLGWALGSYVGGIVAGYNYNLLFWIDGATNIFAAILLLLVLSPKRNKNTPAQAVKNLDNKQQSPYTDIRYLVFTLLTVLFAIAIFQWFSTIPVYFSTQLKLSEKSIGTIMAVNGLIIASIEMVLVSVLEPMQKHLTFIIVGVLLTGLSFMVYNIVPGLFSLAMLSNIIITFGEMLSMPFMNTYMIKSASRGSKGQYAGLYTVAWSTAQILGPYLGALTAEKYGFTTLWWFITFNLLMCAAGFYWLNKKEKLHSRIATTE